MDFKLLKDDDENRLGRLFQLRWKQNDFIIVTIKNAELNSFNRAKINTLLRRIVNLFIFLFTSALEEAAPHIQTGVDRPCLIHHAHFPCL